MGSAARTAIPGLQKLLKDENQIVRQAAAKSLKEIEVGAARH
jgi:HEAT repeat protein